VQRFFGRIFDNPTIVFDEKILRPELQDADAYADGIKHITEAQQRVAQQYFDDGSVEEACPPLQALLHIMTRGEYQGKDVHHPDIRRLFTREYLLSSDWYQRRLRVKQRRDVALWARHVASLDRFLADPRYVDMLAVLDISARKRHAEQELSRVSAPAYLHELHGTLGAEPFGEL